MELDAFRFDLRLVMQTGGNGYPVASRLEPERQRQIRMQVAERAECGDDDLRQYSILAERAVDRVRLHRFARPFRVVAFLADLFAQYPSVLFTRLPLDLVAAQAGRLRSGYNHVAHIAVHMPICGLQTRLIRQREV